MPPPTSAPAGGERHRPFRRRRRPGGRCRGAGRPGPLDTTRTSPLTVAQDAMVIDTTDVPVDEVVRRVLDLVQRQL